MKGEKSTSIGKTPFVIFAVLLISSATIMVFAFQEASPKVKGKVNVDPNGLLDSFLSSTLKRITYTDDNGDTRIYTGWKVQELLVEDIEIRSNMTDGVNLTSLKTGLEGKLSDHLKMMTGVHHYNLKISFGSLIFRIGDIDIEDGARAQTSFHLKSLNGDAQATMFITE